MVSSAAMSSGRTPVPAIACRLALRLVWPVFLALPSAAHGAQAAALGPAVVVTPLDHDVIHSATFQSHNQKVVAHGERIYTSHLRSRNASSTSQTWRLSVSDDGGRTFRPMAEETLATNPPVLEIASDGTLYLFRVDFASGSGFLDTWTPDAPRDITGRTTTVIPGAAAGKYAAILDEPRGRLCFCSHNGTFHRLATDGTIVDSRTLFLPGPHAILQYPHLSLDDEGALHLAWTTLQHGAYLYRSIHHVLSPDGGDTFRTMDGRAVATPLVADESGPATLVTLDDEADVHTWLSSGLARAGKWHALYQAQFQPPRQHAVRYDIATGRREIDLSPEFRGAEIALAGLDGFFVADPRRPRRLYAVGNDDDRLACLVSDDAGTTWRDHARTAERWSLYAIGGARWTTAGGDLIGTFTEDVPPADEIDARSRVFFFRIPGAP
jgi:hypothetical protein